MRILMRLFNTVLIRYYLHFKFLLPHGEILIIVQEIGLSCWWKNPFWSLLSSKKWFLESDSISKYEFLNVNLVNFS